MPSTWIQLPKKPCVMTHSETRGSRRMFFVFSAVSRVLTTMRSLGSTLHVIGDSCGAPSRRYVSRMASWFSRTNASASSTFMSSRVDRLQDVVGDVEVGVDVLHVVVLLERVDHAQHRLRLAGLVELDGSRRQHREVGARRGDTGAFERGAHRVEVARRRGDLPGVALVGDVLSA